MRRNPLQERRKNHTRSQHEALNEKGLRLFLRSAAAASWLFARGKLAALAWTHSPPYPCRMNIGLGHLDFTPLFYGVVMFLGIWSMWHKLQTGKWFGFFVETGVFALVFLLHGGTMAGGFAAMIAALIAGSVLPRTGRK